MAGRRRDRVLKERAEQYGDATTGHENLGLAWTGLLQNHYGIQLDHPIPADVVLLMMAASKANRAARGLKLLDDNYDDGANYFDLAGETARQIGMKGARREKEKPKR